MVNFSTRLVAELTAYKARISTFLIFIDLFSKTKHTRRQRMTNFDPVTFHNLRHLIPVVFHSHRLVDCLGIVIKLYAGVQNTRVCNIFGNVRIGGEVMTAAVSPVREISDSRLVCLIIRLNPGIQYL